MSLEQYKVLVFDCYGGFLQNLEPLLKQPGAPSREKLFSIIGPHETRIQTETPGMLYPEVLQKAYRAAAADLNLEADDRSYKDQADLVDTARAFGASVGSWPAFPDSAAALKRLQDTGLKLVILSNVNVDSFNGSRQKLEHGFKFDAVYVAEQIGSYKPSPRNFEYALKHIEEDFGITNKEEILIVANSKLHDIEPGQKFNLKGAWINRASATMGVTAYQHIKPAFEYVDMKTFAEAMAKDKA